VFSGEGPGEFDGEGAVEVLQESFQWLLSMGPDKENIVNVTEPNERFERCRI
jgi:hypothetical protein